MDASQNPVSLDVPSQIGVAPTQMDPESQESPTQPETPAKDRGHSVPDMLLRSPPSTQEMLDVTLPSAPPGSSSSAAPMEEEDAPLAFSTPPRKKQRDGEGGRASPSLDGALSPEAVSPEQRDTCLRRWLRRSFPAQGQSPSSLSEPTPCPAVKHDPYMPTPLAGEHASREAEAGSTQGPPEQPEPPQQQVPVEMLDEEVGRCLYRFAAQIQVEVVAFYVLFLNNHTEALWNPAALSMVTEQAVEGFIAAYHWQPSADAQPVHYREVATQADRAGRYVH
ncbi:unnamed protein product [Symbiodinium natans]|uniref:Uncharacterized protein n=1 Tax=Symbiodinium natans TaxID=878477 RepID=A0A812UT95_9DINO|nr:unnamed protein product [Symbiodinium natans]